MKEPAYGNEEAVQPKISKVFLKKKNMILKNKKKKSPVPQLRPDTA